MSPFRLREMMERSGKRITALILLVIIIAAQLPIPFSPPAPKDGKDRSTPFPCQDRACGCRTAEQCKKKCCCFTAEQKLAWAKRNGVKPAAVVGVSAECDVAQIPPKKSCCSGHCEKKTNSSSPQQARTKSAPRQKVVIGIVAQECQGNAQTLFGQPVFLIPSIVSLESLIEPTSERVVISECRFRLHMREPPVPPPRLHLA